MSARVSSCRRSHQVRVTRRTHQRYRCFTMRTASTGAFNDPIASHHHEVKVKWHEQFYDFIRWIRGTRVLVVAHRGLHTAAPENSLAAVQAAVRAGCSRIEVDVRATGDGHLVLMHDATLGRTTSGSGTLAEVRAHELGEVRLADGSPVPSLHEVLEVTRDRAVLCIDVKEPELGPDVMALVDTVGAAAEVWSSHREVVARASDGRHFAAWISHGVMPDGGPEELADEATQLGALALSFYPADVLPSVVDACRRASLGVMSGTPNDRLTWANLYRFGVRAVITDRPLDCATWLSEGAAPQSFAGRG